MSDLELNKFEKTIIIIVLVIGFLGGTLLLFVKDDYPIIISLLFATGVSTLVYHFLGGIKNAQFNTGAIKLGGSMAALLASTVLINAQLEEQLDSIKERWHLNADYEIVNAKGKVISKLNFNDFKFRFDNHLNILAGDSIKLGKLSLDDFRITKDFKLLASDSIPLGEVSKENLLDLVGFDHFEVKNYTEIKFNTRLNNFDSQLDNGSWDDVNGYRGIYYAMPFEVIPFENNGAFKTKIRFKDGSEKTAPIKRNESIFLPEVNGEDIRIFIVRVRQVSESKPWDSYDNFVQYQILEMVGGLVLE